ncbi:MAG: Arsenical pump-driving ATPase TEMP, partial [uncultured Friedmanniella sp.]
EPRRPPRPHPGRSPTPARPARRQRQGRHRQDDGVRRPGLRPRHGGPPGAAVRGRGPARHLRALRRPAPGRRRRAAAAPHARRRRRARALHRRRGRSAGVPRHLLPPGAGREGARPLRCDRLRHLDRPRAAGRAAHRQGLRGRPPGTDEPARRLRRRRPGRPADRTDRPVPQRARGGVRAGEDGPDPQPGRLDHDGAARPHDRGAPGDAAGGHAGDRDRGGRHGPGAHPDRDRQRDREHGHSDPARPGGAGPGRRRRPRPGGARLDRRAERHAGRRVRGRGGPDPAAAGPARAADGTRPAAGRRHVRPGRHRRGRAGDHRAAAPRPARPRGCL